MRRLFTVAAFLAVHATPFITGCAKSASEPMLQIGEPDPAMPIDHPPLPVENMQDIEPVFTCIF